MNPFLILPSLIFGFSFARILSGKRGHPGKVRSLKFSIKRFRFHVHHWFLSMMAVASLFFLEFYNDLIYGFLFGTLLQGWTYRDFYKFIQIKKRG